MRHAGRRRRVLRGAVWAALALGGAGCRPHVPDPEGAIAALRERARLAEAGGVPWEEVRAEARRLAKARVRTEEAWWIRGRAARALGRPSEAYHSFERYLELRPYADEIEEVARAEYEMSVEAIDLGRRDLRGRGIVHGGVGVDRTLASAVAHAPFAPFAPDALMRLAEFHAGRERHLQAAEAFEGVRERYFRGGHAAAAHLRGAQELLSAEEDLPYSEVRLDQIRDQLDGLIARVGEGELADQARVLLGRIHVLRAEHRYRIAALYARWNAAQSAAIYRAHLAEEFPDTPWAARARAEGFRE